MAFPEEIHPEIAKVVLSVLGPNRPAHRGWIASWADELDAVYHVTGSELDDLILEMIHTLGKRVPSRRETKLMPKLNTVRDLVEFLANLDAG